MTAPTPRTVAYGAHPDQVADLYLPPGRERVPVVVMLHGGFWLERYRRDLMAGLAQDLVGRRYAVWNVEYRRVGRDGAGGYPATFEDVAAAVDHLALIDGPRLDLGRVLTVGHSAGGQLALWAAGRHRLPSGAPGADPRVRPRGAVGQAAVSDLALAAARGLGGGAVRRLLGGGPGEVPARYALADPSRLLPLGIPQLLVHGCDDTLVPPAISERYADEARRAGDRVVLEMVPGGHLGQLEPSSDAWRVVTGWLGSR